MKTFVAMLSTLVISGCGGLSSSECTLIGCLGELEVRVVNDVGEPVTAFNGVATDAAGRQIVFACPASADAEYRCGASSVRLFLLGESAPPDAVELSIAAGTDAPIARTINPTWTSTEINGPGCGHCHSGVVTVALEF